VGILSACCTAYLSKYMGLDTLNGVDEIELKILLYIYKGEIK